MGNNVTLSGLVTRYAGGALLLLALLLGIVVQQVISRTLDGALHDKAEALARQLAVVSLDAVLVYDYGTLERYVGDLERGADVLYLRIRRADGETLAEAGMGEATTRPGTLSLTQPMRLADNIIGDVTVAYDRSAMERTVVLLSMLWLGGLALVTLAMFWALRWLLRRRVVAPLQALAESVSPLAGDEAPLVPRVADGPQEVVLLAQTFERMRGEIRQHIHSIEHANRLARTATQRFCREQRLASIGQMAAGLAHGLNTPLGNIIGYVQQARRGADTALEQRLSVVERQVNKCSEIVRNLLSAARAPEIVLQRADLTRVIGANITLIRPVMRDHGAEITQGGERSCPAVCDVGAFEQVLFNLASNAVQAGARQITIHLGREGDQILVEVSDDGPGIPTERQSAIFEPFFTTKEAGSGTGLGLYLCRTLMESMQGQILLHQSRPGRTVFRLRLPAVPEKNDDATDCTDR